MAINPILLKERWKTDELRDDAFSFVSKTVNEFHMGGADGKQPHPDGTPQSVHAGGSKVVENAKDAIYNQFFSDDDEKSSGWYTGQIFGLSDSEDVPTKEVAEKALYSLEKDGLIVSETVKIGDEMKTVWRKKNSSGYVKPDVIETQNSPLQVAFKTGKVQSSDKDDPFDKKYQNFDDVYEDYADEIAKYKDTDTSSAVSHYVDSGYRDINALKRGRKYSSEVSEVIRGNADLLEGYINDNPLRENILLFRGTRLSPDQHFDTLSGFDEKFMNPSLDIEFSDKGFFSSSTVQGVAEGFAETSSAPSVIFYIAAHKGSKAAPSLWGEHNEIEREFIFAPSTKFKVHEVNRYSNAQDIYVYEVFMETINE